MGGRDHVAAAFVDAHVVDVAVRVGAHVEEHEVAAPGAASALAVEAPELGIRGPGDRLAVVAVHEVGEPTAVEARAGRAAAVHVGHSPYERRHVRGCLLVERQRMRACRSWEKRQRYCHRSGDGAYLMSHRHRPAPLMSSVDSEECAVLWWPASRAASWSLPYPRD